MSLVQDYSSSDSEDEITTSKPLSKGPLTFVVKKPKFEPDSDDEDSKNIKGIIGQPSISSLKFDKLKFRGTKSSLFDMLPPLKAISDEEDTKTIKDKTRPKHETSGNKETTAFSAKSKPKLASLVPRKFLVKSVPKAQIESEAEPLFPLGANIQDAYLDPSLPTDAIHIKNTQQVEAQSGQEDFYYGYDYSANNSQPQIYQQTDDQPQLVDSVEDSDLAYDLNNKKRRGQAFNFQDVNLADHLLTPDQLAEARSEQPNHSAFGNVSMPMAGMGMHRYNITYLAAQAKSRDSELQSQYLQNKKAKKESRAKYGF